MMDAKRLREVIVVALSLLLAYSGERSTPKLAFDAWTVHIPDRNPLFSLRGMSLHMLNKVPVLVLECT